MLPSERRLVRRRVLAMALPYIVESFSDVSLFLADLLMISRYDRTGVAALGVAGPISYTLSMVLGVLRVGIVATVSRAIGERDADKQKRAAAAGLLVVIVVGLAGSALGVTALPYLTHLFEIKDKPQAVDLAFQYIQITAGALLFFLLQVGGSAILRAAGNTRVPMIIGIASNLFNIGGNFVLIYGYLGFPELGVRGAAISTALSEAIYGTSVVVFLFSKRSPIGLALSDLAAVTRERISTLLRVTLPAALEPLILQTGFLLYIRTIAGLGYLSMTTHRTAISLESLTFMPGNAIAIACSALVGQALGAKKPEEAVQSFHESSRLALYLMAAVGLTYLLFGGPIMEIFVPRQNRDDEVIIAMGATCLAIVAFSEPFFSQALVLGGALRGAGDTKTPVLVAAIGVWGVRVPGAYLLAVGAGLGLYGAWITMVLDWLVRMIVLLYFFKRGKWKEIQL